MRTLRIAESASIAIALLPCIVSCDGESTGPGENASPTVIIEKIEYSGYDPIDAIVSFHAIDQDTKEKLQLERGEYFLNGTQEGSFAVSGSNTQSKFTIPRLSPDNYSLEVKVYDKVGATGKDSKTFTITAEPRRVTAEVYINRLSGIERMTGGELCLSNNCAPISPQGVARFDSLSSEGPVKVHIPAGLHPQFMVSLGDSRLDMNIINYTNVDYVANRTPTDTLVLKGENHRRIVFFENTSRWQEIIDDYSDKTGQYYNHVWGFVHPGDTLSVYASTISGEVSDSLAQKIWKRAGEAVNHANDVYGSIPWDDPHKYVMKTGMRTEYPLPVNSGDMIIDPNTTRFQWEGILAYPKNIFAQEAMVAMLNVNHAFGEKGIEHFTKYSILTFLAGITAFAPRGSDRFTQYPSTISDILHDVVDDDLLGMRMYIIFSPGTQFLSTEEIEEMAAPGPALRSRPPFQALLEKYRDDVGH